MRLSPNRRRAQVQALEELFISLISCVQKDDVQLALSTHCRKKRCLMNLGGRVERITEIFIRKWGNQYVKYWEQLAELRDEGPEVSAHQVYCRKQAMILVETERLIADLHIGITSGMRETVEDMLHHETLHVDLLAFPE